MLLQGLPHPLDAAGLPGVVVGQQLLVPAKTKRGRAAAVGCQQLSVTPSAAGMLQVRCVSVQQLLFQLLLWRRQLGGSTRPGMVRRAVSVGLGGGVGGRRVMPLEPERVQKKCYRNTFTTQLRYVVCHVLMRPRARACAMMLFCCEGTFRKPGPGFVGLWREWTGLPPPPMAWAAQVVVMGCIEVALWRPC